MSCRRGRISNFSEVQVEEKRDESSNSLRRDPTRPPPNLLVHFLNQSLDTPTAKPSRQPPSSTSLLSAVTILQVEQPGFP